MSESALMNYYIGQGLSTKDAQLRHLNAKDAFDAMMEGAALMLDFIGKIEYTYTTKSGNTVHGILDSP